MEREFTIYLRLQERRIDLLRSLCASFRESHKAIAGLNLDAMYQTTFEQETICTAIRSIDEELKAAQRAIETNLRIDLRIGPTGSQLPSALPVESPVATELAERLRSVARELESAQAEVRQMNKVQAALLRRSRRSVNVLVNFLANYTETYKPPQAGALQPVPNAGSVGASAGVR